jgi:diguanylate cyclase (GGDEF)-like protein
MYLLFQNLLQSWIRRDADSYIPSGHDRHSGGNPGILEVGQSAANSSIKAVQAASLLQKGIIELIVKRFSLYALLTICWLLIACAGLAVAVFLDIQRETQRFSEKSALIQTQLVSQTRRYVDAAHGLAAFLKVQEPLNREKIAAYTRLIADQDAGIYFMGAIPNFDQAELDEFMGLRLHESVPNGSSDRAVSDKRNSLVRVAASKPFLYPPNSVEPYADEIRLMSSIDSDFVPAIRNAFQRAVKSKEITVSHSFLLDRGDWGYALVAPVSSADGVSFAVVVCRVKALLHLPSDFVSLALTVFESAHDGAKPSDRLIHRSASPVTSLESALFPKLLFRSSLGEPEKLFVLEIEQQLGWANLDWDRLRLIFVGSLAFLLVFFGVARIHDRYERRKLEEGNRLFMLANFDPLTGLPNRQLFMNRLEQALTSAARSKLKVAVLYLDLDGFKQVNDYYGHQTGDKVLQRAARIFQHSVRETDTVGRLGGDEFVVLLQNIGDRSGAESVARKIKKAFRQPSVEPNGISKILPVLGTSVGVAVYPEDGSTSAELLKAADQAMYRDKAASKNQQDSISVLKSLDCHPVSWWQSLPPLDSP